MTKLESYRKEPDKAPEDLQFDMVSAKFTLQDTGFKLAITTEEADASCVVSDEQMFKLFAFMREKLFTASE